MCTVYLQIMYTSAHSALDCLVTWPVPGCLLWLLDPTFDLWTRGFLENRKTFWKFCSEKLYGKRDLQRFSGVFRPEPGSPPFRATSRGETFQEFARVRPAFQLGRSGFGAVSWVWFRMTQETTFFLFFLLNQGAAFLEHDCFFGQTSVFQGVLLNPGLDWTEIGSYIVWTIMIHNEHINQQKSVTHPFTFFFLMAPRLIWPLGDEHPAPCSSLQENWSHEKSSSQWVMSSLYPGEHPAVKPPKKTRSPSPKRYLRFCFHPQPSDAFYFMRKGTFVDTFQVLSEVDSWYLMMDSWLSKCDLFGSECLDLPARANLKIPVSSHTPTNTMYSLDVRAVICFRIGASCFALSEAVRAIPWDCSHSHHAADPQFSRSKPSTNTNQKKCTAEAHCIFLKCSGQVSTCWWWRHLE